MRLEKLAAETKSKKGIGKKPYLIEMSDVGHLGLFPHADPHVPRQKKTNLIALCTLSIFPIETKHYPLATIAPS